MEVIEDKSESFDIECQNCGSLLRVKSGEILKGGKREKFACDVQGFSIPSEYVVKIISQCPCCLKQNAEVLYIGEKEQMEKEEKSVLEYMEIAQERRYRKGLKELNV